jgi:hypothetical protein
MIFCVELTTHNGSKRINSITVYRQNVQSITKKGDELSINLQMNHIEPHLISLNKHHLKESEITKFSLERYKLASRFCRRESMGGGGVCILISNNLVCILINDNLVCVLISNNLMYILINSNLMYILIRSNLMCILISNNLVCILIRNNLVYILIRNNLVCILISSNLVCILIGSNLVCILISSNLVCILINDNLFFQTINLSKFCHKKVFEICAVKLHVRMKTLIIFFAFIGPLQGT